MGGVGKNFGDKNGPVYLAMTQKPTSGECYISMCFEFNSWHKNNMCVATYEVHLQNLNPLWHKWSQDDDHLLIPVPPPVYGFLIIGQSRIAYKSVNDSGDADKEIRFQPPSITRAYGRVSNGCKFLLGNDAGKLNQLVLDYQNNSVTGLRFELLGQTSIASTISCLNNSLVYIGSSHGDSQLIEILQESDEGGPYVKVLENYCNIGPIVDLSVNDIECIGYGQIVTCSGANRDGSLHSLQNAFGIVEQASQKLKGINGLWSLKSCIDDAHGTLLVVSFINETLIFEIFPQCELRNAEIEGFCSEVSTLCCHGAIDSHNLSR